jgi:hypothetical protein
VGPHTGEAVRLELQAHRQPIRLGLRAGRLLALADLVADAHQVLHVVPDLVRDHVRLGEVAGRAEPIAQLAEEIEVDVHLAVGRAVERSHGRGRGTAAGVHLAREQVQPGVPVLAPRLLELGRPHRLRVLGQELDEGGLLGLGLVRDLVGRPLGHRPGELLDHAAEPATAPGQEGDQGDDDPDQPAAGGERHAHATPDAAGTPQVVDVLTLRPAPFHGLGVPRWRPAPAHVHAF